MTSHATPITARIKPIVWIGIGLSVFQQFVGINVAFYYSSTLWQSVGVDPSEEMLRDSVRRCADLVRAGKVRVRLGTAEDTGAEKDSVDVVLSPTWSGSTLTTASCATPDRPSSGITTGPDTAI